MHAVLVYLIWISLIPPFLSFTLKLHIGIFSFHSSQLEVRTAAPTLTAGRGDRANSDVRHVVFCAALLIYFPVGVHSYRIAVITTIKKEKKKRLLQ